MDDPDGFKDAGCPCRLRGGSKWLLWGPKLASGISRQPLGQDRLIVVVVFLVQIPTASACQSECWPNNYSFLVGCSASSKLGGKNDQVEWLQGLYICDLGCGLILVSFANGLEGQRMVNQFDGLLLTTSVKQHKCSICVCVAHMYIK
jgi:hypothetical protein